MGIQNWSDEIILVDLQQEPQMGEELNTVVGMVRDRGNCDVVIDFSSIDIVTSSSLSKSRSILKVFCMNSSWGSRYMLARATFSS